MMLIRRTLTFILPALAFRAFSQTSLVDDPLRHVDPMIGTQRMGHVYPGATAPFGMVQLSPDTDTLPYAVNGRYNPEVYRTCSGYQFDDSTIVGFSHTHFSGTGHSDLGDILLMPTTGALQLDPGTAADPQSGFRSVFHHANEKAEPGKYEVLLEDHGIKAELTATTRHEATLYVLDEPTTGLHLADVEKLINVLSRLVELRFSGIQFSRARISVLLSQAFLCSKTVLRLLQFFLQFTQLFCRLVAGRPGFHQVLAERGKLCTIEKTQACSTHRTKN